ncbi:MAG: CHAD domain-containing protein, partial [Methylomarinum sp.]|nr:CHAD domain-containing protein [Methylomarinum sp.]
QQYAIKAFYDSFDWRLYRDNKTFEFNQAQSTSHVNLIDRNSGNLLATEELDNVPDFAEEFSAGDLKTHLISPLGMRALLPLCQLPHEIYRANILDKEQQTIAQIQIDEYEFLTNRVSLKLENANEADLKHLSDIFQNTLELQPAQNLTALNSALKQQGRKPKNYSSKIDIKLNPEMSADKASKKIFKHLLQIMRVNEADTIVGTDAEFLHDFRVAVRCTRVGLNQIKHTLPASIVTEYADFFSWLGQVTGLTREMDVYLLKYQQYQAVLPVELHEDIAPLYDFLQQKQIQAQSELAEKLNSVKYRKQLSAWEQCLNEAFPAEESGRNANMNIKALADQRIWKVYKRFIKEASLIGEYSKPETLHDLLKTGKKLRYLMLFFKNLYPESEMKTLSKSLKVFLSVLADFQDYEVQEVNIKKFSKEMDVNATPINTFVAMDVLTQYLSNKKFSSRNDFYQQFADFNQLENHAVFKQLFEGNA